MPHRLFLFHLRECFSFWNSNISMNLALTFDLKYWNVVSAFQTHSPWIIHLIDCIALFFNSFEIRSDEMLTFSIYSNSLEHSKFISFDCYEKKRRKVQLEVRVNFELINSLLRMLGNGKFGDYLSSIEEEKKREKWCRPTGIYELCISVFKSITAVFQMVVRVLL